MSYVRSVLQPGEEVIFTSRIHWTIYLAPLVALAVTAGFGFLFHSNLYVPNALDAGTMRLLLGYATLALLAITLVMFMGAWFKRATTEIAVTDKRVIYKRGLIWRRTKEINMEKIESVDVDQTILGRVLGFGTVVIHGTGSVSAPFFGIDDPLQFRNSITAR